MLYGRVGAPVKCLLSAPSSSGAQNTYSGVFLLLFLCLQSLSPLPRASRRVINGCLCAAALARQPVTSLAVSARGGLGGFCDIITKLCPKARFHVAGMAWRLGAQQSGGPQGQMAFLMRCSHWPHPSPNNGGLFRLREVTSL